MPSPPLTLKVLVLLGTVNFQTALKLGKMLARKTRSRETRVAGFHGPGPPPKGSSTFLYLQHGSRNRGERKLARLSFLLPEIQRGIFLFLGFSRVVARVMTRAKKAIKKTSVSLL